MSGYRGSVTREGIVSVYGAEELKEVLADFSSADGELMKRMNAAVKRAMNKTVKPYLMGIAEKEYAVKSGALAESVKFGSMKSQTGVGHVLKLRSNRLGIAQFDILPSHPENQKGKPVKDRYSGVIARVRRGAPREMKGTFVARMSSGHIGVFQRVRPRVTAKTGNAKIRELISLSMAEMIRAQKKALDGSKMGVPEIRRELTEQIRISVEKAKASYQRKMAREGASA